MSDRWDEVARALFKKCMSTEEAYDAAESAIAQALRNAVGEEREVNAKLAEEHVDEPQTQFPSDEARLIMKAIRSRTTESTR